MAIENGLTFLSFAVFENLFKEGVRKLFDNSVIICDEFDSIIFGKNETASAAYTIIPNLNFFIGFTGSDLKDIHGKAIQRAICGNLIKMNVDNIFKPLPQCKGVDVYSKISEFREAIAQLAT